MHRNYSEVEPKLIAYKTHLKTHRIASHLELWIRILKSLIKVGCPSRFSRFYPIFNMKKALALVVILRCVTTYVRPLVPEL